MITDNFLYCNTSLLYIWLYHYTIKSLLHTNYFTIICSYSESSKKRSLCIGIETSLVSSVSHSAISWHKEGKHKWSPCAIKLYGIEWPFKVTWQLRQKPTTPSQGEYYGFSDKAVTCFIIVKHKSLKDHKIIIWLIDNRQWHTSTKS